MRRGWSFEANASKSENQWRATTTMLLRRRGDGLAPREDAQIVACELKARLSPGSADVASYP